MKKIIIAASICVLFTILVTRFYLQAKYPKFSISQHTLTENKNYKDEFIVKTSHGLFRIDSNNKAVAFFLPSQDSQGYEIQVDRKRNKLYILQDFDEEKQNTIYSCDILSPTCTPKILTQITAVSELLDPYLALPQTERDLLHRETIGISDMHISPGNDYLSFDMDGKPNLQSSDVDFCLHFFPMIIDLNKNIQKPLINPPICGEDASAGALESWLNNSEVLIGMGGASQDSFAVLVTATPINKQAITKGTMLGYQTPGIDSATFEFKTLFINSSNVFVSTDSFNTDQDPVYSFIPLTLLNNSENENVNIIRTYPSLKWSPSLKAIFNYPDFPIVADCSDRCKLLKFSTETNHVDTFSYESKTTSRIVNLMDITYTIEKYSFDNGMMLVHIYDNHPSWEGNQQYTDHYFLVDTLHNIYDDVLTSDKFMSSEPAYY